jgi:UDP:flavonoid glycosyltransferase YjiC (YdhE family)
MSRTKFIFTTLPTNDLGLLTRSLPIASELAERGHEVVYCSPGQAPRKLIAEAGFDNLLPRHPIYHLLAAGPSFREMGGFLVTGRREWGTLGFLSKLLRATPTRLAGVTSEVWDMDHLGALSGMLNANFVRANCDALMTLMVECGADVVVDFWNPFACMAARALGKPLATVIQADMHPDGRGFIWWKERPPDLPRALPTVNEVLAGYGLPPVGKMEELCVGDLTLVLGMPETDPLPQGTQAIYVGPILWQKPGAELPDWINALGQDRPVIWVYSGNPRYMPIRTPVDSVVVLHACVAALADEDVQVVLTTGHHALPQDILPLPDNFRHELFVPGLAMARRSDLLIHHGGYGSCQTGLYTGTPAVIIPTYSERESNARRVAAVGAGEWIRPQELGRNKRVRGDELRAKVRQVLSDPRYTVNAQQISARMQVYGGASEAARLIQDLAMERQI